MNIYEILKEGHREIDELLHQLPEMEEGHERVFLEVKEALEVHTQAEESHFYEALESREEVGDLIERAEEDHDELDELIESVEGLEPGGKEWRRAIRNLEKAFKRHVEFEEERLFSVAKELFDPEEAELMGQDFEQTRDRLLRELRGERTSA